MKLKDKVVIITGGAGGIGAGMGRAMVKEGAIVVAVDLNPEAGAKIFRLMVDGGSIMRN